MYCIDSSTSSAKKEYYARNFQENALLGTGGVIGRFWSETCFLRALAR